MRKINEQWIEDGRMLKAVAGNYCKGCAFGKMGNSSRQMTDIHICDRENECPFDCSDMIIKDLGPVNADGCLAEERTGEYPIITEWASITGLGTIWTVHVVKTGVISVMVWGKTRQQAIDAWNQKEATNEL